MSRRDVIAGMTAAPLVGAAAAQAWSLPEKRPFREVPNAWITMADGVRLSARLWIPQGAEAGPVPAVFEYIPYRKHDGYRFHDDLWGPTLAGYGVAYARVDVRGSGDSEGVLVDEYLPSELQDGCACIAWLAAQPWCSGKVGMRGISWGGINTLQVAAMHPPALKAIMPMCCMGDRFTDDAHYIGGALGHTNFQWGVAFKTVMAGPPDPQIVGEAWEAMWRQRLEATPAILETWVGHERYDAYWKRGSTEQDWSAIEVPAYIVSGWQDTYSNAVGPLLAGLKVPRKALIGPWGHTYPYLAQPLGLEWAFEEVRWWEQWLKGVDTGIMNEPMLRAFMPYRAPSEVVPAEIPGRWVAEAAWPPRTTSRVLHLTAGGLAEVAGPPATVRCVGDRIVGLAKPEWLDRPPVEQSPDDAKSLTFDTQIPMEDLEILGNPLVRMRVAADRPVAKLALRLTEVTAEGQSWLVSWAVCNLTHRVSHSAPEPLVPGEPYDVDIPLAMIAHRFRAGSRIRLAVSESLWPLVWPSPEVATLTLTLGGASTLSLPVRPQEAAPSPFPIPERRTPPSEGAKRPGTAIEPVSPGRYLIENDSPPAPYVLKATGATLARGRWETSEIREGDPGSCRWTQRAYSSWTRGDWDCAVEASYELTSTAEEFLLSENLTAKRGERLVFERRKASRIKRDLA
ncbi:MAG: CocE/NonD family hydrolase [Caulobacterales bacterium]